MGPAPICGIDHKPRKEEFTENWRHESQTSKPKHSASRCLSEITKNTSSLSLVHKGGKCGNETCKVEDLSKQSLGKVENQRSRITDDEREADS